MSASERSGEAMELAVVNAAHGANFSLEQGRLSHLDGRIGAREGITHRLIMESGGGQTRSQQPAGRGGVPS